MVLIHNDYGFREVQTSVHSEPHFYRYTARIVFIKRSENDASQHYHGGVKYLTDVSFSLLLEFLCIQSLLVDIN